MPQRHRWCRERRDGCRRGREGCCRRRRGWAAHGAQWVVGDPRDAAGRGIRNGPGPGPLLGKAPGRAGPGANPGGERGTPCLGRDIGDRAVHHAAHQAGVLRRRHPARRRAGPCRALQGVIRRSQRRQVRGATRPVSRRDGLAHTHQGNEDRTQRRCREDRPDRCRTLVTAPSPPQGPPPPLEPAPSAAPRRAAGPRPVRAPERPPSTARPAHPEGPHPAPPRSQPTVVPTAPRHGPRPAPRPRTRYGRRPPSAPTSAPPPPPPVRGEPQRSPPSRIRRRGRSAGRPEPGGPGRGRQNWTLIARSITDRSSACTGPLVTTL